MRKILLFITIAFIACSENPKSNIFFSESLPTDVPIPFKLDLVPVGMLIHSGIFSPNLEQYYYTLSDQNFFQFTVKMIYKKGNEWSKPVNAFFNSEYNEHGMNFSPDGQYLYFSSTRPTGIDGIPETWHIWRSHKINGEWSEAEFIDIPNLRQRLVSHPTISNDGSIYFHSGTTNYADLELFYAQQVDGKFQEAIKLPPEVNIKPSLCTPYIAPDESYIIFEGTTVLYISFKDENGKWKEAKALDDAINKNGRGNPYITPDEKYLFFAAGVEPNPNEKWAVYWVSTESVFNRN